MGDRNRPAGKTFASDLKGESSAGSSNNKGGYTPLEEAIDLTDDSYKPSNENSPLQVEQTRDTVGQGTGVTSFRKVGGIPTGPRAGVPNHPRPRASLNVHSHRFDTRSSWLPLQTPSDSIRVPSSRPNVIRNSVADEGWGIAPEVEESGTSQEWQTPERLETYHFQETGSAHYSPYYSSFDNSSQGMAPMQFAPQDPSTKRNYANLGGPYDRPAPSPSHPFQKGRPIVRGNSKNSNSNGGKPKSFTPTNLFNKALEEVGQNGSSKANRYLNAPRLGNDHHQRRPNPTFSAFGSGSQPHNSKFSSPRSAHEEGDNFVTDAERAGAARAASLSKRMRSKLPSESADSSQTRLHVIGIKGKGKKRQVEDSEIVIDDSADEDDIEDAEPNIESTHNYNRGGRIPIRHSYPQDNRSKFSTNKRYSDVIDSSPDPLRLLGNGPPEPSTSRTAQRESTRLEDMDISFAKSSENIAVAVQTALILKEFETPAKSNRPKSTIVASMKPRSTTSPNLPSNLTLGRGDPNNELEPEIKVSSHAAASKVVSKRLPESKAALVRDPGESITVTDIHPYALRDNYCFPLKYVGRPYRLAMNTNGVITNHCLTIQRQLPTTEWREVATMRKTDFSGCKLMDDESVPMLNLTFRRQAAVWKALCEESEVNHRDFTDPSTKLTLSFLSKDGIKPFCRLMQAWSSDNFIKGRISGGGSVEERDKFHLALEQAKKDQKGKQDKFLSDITRKPQSRQVDIADAFAKVNEAAVERQQLQKRIASDAESEIPRRRSHRMSHANSNIGSGNENLTAGQRTPERLKMPLEKLLLVYPFAGTGSVSVTYGDFRRLDHDEFLNDTLIEFGLKRAMIHLEETNPSLASQVYMFNSFFYKKLSQRRPPKDVEFDPYQSVRKWTQKLDLFDKKYVIVPINEHLHWYLAIIVNPKAILRPPAVRIPLPRTRSSAFITQIDNDDEEGATGTRSPFFSLREGDIDADEELEEEILQKGIAEAVKNTRAGGEDSETGEADGDVRMGVEGLTVSDGYLNATELPSTDREGLQKGQPEDVSMRGISSNSEDTTVGGLLPESKPLDVDSEGDDLKSDNDSNQVKADGKDPSSKSDVDETCYIFTFDSLGSSHSPVIKRLQHYLEKEAEDKKGLSRECVSASEAKGGKVVVPLQPNFSDCGLYLLHYVEVFLANPELMHKFILDTPVTKEKDAKFMTEVVSREWKQNVVERKRNTMREDVKSLGESWSEYRIPIDEQERKEKEEKQRKKKEQREADEAALAAALAAQRETEERLGLPPGPAPILLAKVRESNGGLSNGDDSDSSPSKTRLVPNSSAAAAAPEETGLPSEQVAVSKSGKGRKKVFTVKNRKKLELDIVVVSDDDDTSPIRPSQDMEDEFSFDGPLQSVRKPKPPSAQKKRAVSTASEVSSLSEEGHSARGASPTPPLPVSSPVNDTNMPHANSPAVSSPTRPSSAIANQGSTPTPPPPPSGQWASSSKERATITLNPLSTAERAQQASTPSNIVCKSSASSNSANKNAGDILPVTAKPKVGFFNSLRLKVRGTGSSQSPSLAKEEVESSPATTAVEPVFEAESESEPFAKRRKLASTAKAEKGKGLRHRDSSQGIHKRFESGGGRGSGGGDDKAEDIIISSSNSTSNSHSNHNNATALDRLGGGGGGGGVSKKKDALQASDATSAAAMAEVSTHSIDDRPTKTNYRHRPKKTSSQGSDESLVMVVDSQEEDESSRGAPHEQRRGVLRRSMGAAIITPGTTNSGDLRQRNSSPRTRPEPSLSALRDAAANSAAATSALRSRGDGLQGQGRHAEKADGGKTAADSSSSSSAQKSLRNSTNSKARGVEESRFEGTTTAATTTTTITRHSNNKAKGRAEVMTIDDD